MLQARYRICVVGPEHVVLRVLCGRINCRGEFGELVVQEITPQGERIWKAILDAGYVERPADYWALGHHASRSRRHAPRRPRRIGMPTGMHLVGRNGDGALVLHHPYENQVFPIPTVKKRDTDGRLISSKQIATPFITTRSYAFRCIRCNAESTFRLDDLGGDGEFPVYPFD